MNALVVQSIPRAEAEPWILAKHYAHRMPCMTYAFGVYDSGILCGIVSYGPSNNPKMMSGICGVAFADRVIELNRLVVDSANPNTASVLVGRSLRLLPKPSIVVSYADASFGHVGYIYQACNFMYTGCPEAHQAAIEIDGRKVNTRSLGVQFGKVGKFNGLGDAKTKLGDRLRVLPRERKHRYVYFTGTARQKEEMRKAMKYAIEPYPKGETKRYDASAEVSRQLILL